MAYARHGNHSGRYDPSVSDIRIGVIAEEIGVLKGIIKDLALMVDHLRQRMDEKEEVKPGELVESVEVVKSTDLEDKKKDKNSPMGWPARLLSRLYQYRYYISVGVVGVSLLTTRGWNHIPNTNTMKTTNTMKIEKTSK